MKLNLSHWLQGITALSYVCLSVLGSLCALDVEVAVAAESLSPTNAVPQAHSPGIKKVSLLAIIAAPERFDRKEVRVTGFISTMEGFSVIQFSLESSSYSIGQNLVYLDLSQLQDARKADLRRVPTGRCCEIRGTVDASNVGKEATGVKMTACSLIVTAFEERAKAGTPTAR
jgi:hypothetical protein